MKTVIFTEGGKNIGLGHISQCIALSQSLEEFPRDKEVKFVINGDKSIEEFMLKSGIENVHFFDWTNEKNNIVPLIKESDIAIVDSYLADRPFYEKVSSCVRFPLYIDDYKKSIGKRINL